MKYFSLPFDSKFNETLAITADLVILLSFHNLLPGTLASLVFHGGGRSSPKVKVRLQELQKLRGLSTCYHSTISL